MHRHGNKKCSCVFLCQCLCKCHGNQGTQSEPCPLPLGFSGEFLGLFRQPEVLPHQRHEGGGCASIASDNAKNHLGIARTWGEARGGHDQNANEEAGLNAQQAVPGQGQRSHGDIGSRFLCLGAVMAAMYSRLARSMVERIDHLHAATRGDGRDGHQLHRLQPLHHFMWVRAG